jgi:ribonuclease Z
MSVEWTRVNGLLGDPAIHVFFPKTGDALLFDLGSLESLANRDLLKVRAAFVSHTHIDHFIGFDRWLRVNIPHFRQLELGGPPGLLANVRGKLAGYCWNLLEADQLRFVVHELGPDGQTTSSLLRNQTRYAPEPFTRQEPRVTPVDAPLPVTPAACVTTLSDGTRVQAVALDHGTPSIAYSLQGPCRFQTRTDVLQSLELKPGPWIRALQMAATQQRLDETVVVDGRSFRAADLASQVFEIRRPKPLGYLTDAGFTRPNLERARRLLEGVDTLICETNYRDTDYSKARAKMHLTTRQAALIAASARAAELAIFHVSNLYSDDPQAVVAEAAAHFAELKALPAEALEAAIEAELNR